jgi:type I restriction enzyme, S subunit
VQEKTSKLHSKRSHMIEKSILASSEKLPDGWCWVQFKNIAITQNGRSFPSKSYQDSGIRLLRPGNLHVSGKIVWTKQNTKYLPESFSKNYPTFLIKPNEIIMNLTAQSLKDEFLGRVCLTDENSVSLLNQRLARIKPKSALDTRYLFWALKSPLFRNFVKGLESGTLIQHMFTWQLESFQVPLAPPKEQKTIVDKIESFLLMANEVEKSNAATFNLLGILDQRIFAKAFRGELVPQNPEDEHASVILERIKAQA